MKITGDQIRNMSKEEYEKFRHECWQNRVRKNSSSDCENVPHWFLSSKESYIEYLKNAQTKLDNYQQNKGKTNMTRRVDDLASEDIDSFADDK